MWIYIVAILLAVALVISLCVIAEQRDIIRRQGKRLLEALDWIEPEALVRGDRGCNGDCTDCFFAEVDE